MAQAAEDRRWAAEYETIYILRPNASVEDADKVAGRIDEVVERLGGKLTKVDNWGKRKLAYTIKKHTRGIFVYVRYVGLNDLVAELERNLRMLDPVIRYQTIVLYRGIDPAEIEVDPEEVKFLPIEVTEDEEEPGLAQQLGLSTPERKREEREEVQASEESSEGESEAEGESAKAAEGSKGEASEGESTKASEGSKGEASEGEGENEAASEGEAEKKSEG